jgi:phospholipid transport system transporter-binding protein
VSAGLEQVETGRYRLYGELDLSTIRELSLAGAKLFAVLPRCDIDLAEVKHSSSAGLALLIEWMKFARARECDLNLINLPAQLQRMARLSGLERVLPVDSI